MIEAVRGIVLDEPGEIWVFGYGSLMWDPGFAYREMRPALLRGYHRAFCVWSKEYRGTPGRPGLVLGLVPGGSCHGRAYRVAERDRVAAIDYLRRREIPEDIYVCRKLPLAAGAERVRAFSFVVHRGHDLYAGRLSLEETARNIAVSAGERGTNRDYLANTVEHLDALGIADTSLHRLKDIVDAIA